MEEGSLRCDANVSLRPRGATELGTKVEIKNLNSFRNVQHALEYEVVRQTRALDAGERHRAGDAAVGSRPRRARVSMRSKEYAHDYRYFPEPDLPPLHARAPRGSTRSARRCPSCRRRAAPAVRRASTGCSAYDAELLTQGRALADYFEAAARGHANPKAIANWILNELLRELPGDDEAAVARSPVPPAHLAGLVRADRRRHDQRQDRQGRVREDAGAAGEDAATIVRREGLTQVADAGALQARGRPGARGQSQGRGRLQGRQEGRARRLVGQVMKASGGQGESRRS